MLTDIIDTEIIPTNIIPTTVYPEIINNFIEHHGQEFPDLSSISRIMIAIETYLEFWDELKESLYYKNHPEEISDDVEGLDAYLQDYIIAQFQFLRESKKTEIPKIPTNNTPIDTGVYMYWITLTPPMNTDKTQESLLRDFIQYLIPKVPHVFGCFEKGEGNDNFHSHLLVSLSTSLDKSKAPWQNYLKTCKGVLLFKKNFELCKNYEFALLKARYCVMESKDNYGYFGDYKYWDDLFKEKTGQVIKAGFSDFPNYKEKPNHKEKPKKPKLAKNQNTDYIVI